MAKAALVVGGSGYLGQHLTRALIGGGWRVSVTYRSNEDAARAARAAGAAAVRCDVATDEGASAAAAEAERVGAAVVINCAALSQPRKCQEDPQAARAANSPARLLRALAAVEGATPVFVHISTDQVYKGDRAVWAVGDATEPVNAYGETKLAAEDDVREAAPPGGAVVLRSSIIYGPEAPLASVGRPLFVQFVEGALIKGEPTSFFDDEWRCPVYVGDFARAIEAIAGGRGVARGGFEVYNFGGPERLSRVDMARAVARACALSEAAIVEASAATVDRGVASPPDISMDSRPTEEALGFSMARFEDALRQHVFVGGGA